MKKKQLKKKVRPLALRTGIRAGMFDMFVSDTIIH
jgi:hypothetical protein